MTRGIVVDIAGQKFGRLIALEIVGNNYKNERVWRCVCDCGNEKNVSSSELRNGNTKSCGCYRVEWASNRRRACNESYFSVPNIENSYWAGFIAADGNIHKRNEKRQAKLGIGLSSEDRRHLENFVEDVGYKGRISSFTDSHGRGIVSIGITSDKICDDLKENFNIVPRKSLILEPPNITNECMVKAFIRGYIDGDGSMGVYRRCPRFSVIGTNIFLNWVRDKLSEYTGIEYSSVKREPGKNHYYFIVTGEKCKKTLSSLWEVKTPFIIRKWKRIFYS